MSQILDGQEGVVCQVDDILVYGKDTAEHDRHLDQVMEQLKEAGVTLYRKKCKFAVSKVNFLGHVITSKGIKPDPEKLAAILEMEEPEDVSAVRQFLGMINYLGKFILIFLQERNLFEISSTNTAPGHGIIPRNEPLMISEMLSDLHTYSKCMTQREKQSSRPMLHNMV